MSKIGTTEDALIELIKTTMASKVRTVEWAPPEWDEDYIKRNLKSLPGVFLIFGGGPSKDPGGASIQLDSRWSVVAVTGHVQEAKQRARGDTKAIGCYEILETLIPKLDGFSVTDVGTLQFIAWDNDAAMKLEQGAVMVQSASFRMNVELPRTIPASALADFETFAANYDVGQAAGAPPTGDVVTLPQS